MRNFVVTFAVFDRIQNGEKTTEYRKIGSTLSKCAKTGDIILFRRGYTSTTIKAKITGVRQQSAPDELTQITDKVQSGEIVNAIDFTLYKQEGEQ